MKKLELAICDIDAEYITSFASYLIERFREVNIHVFTTPESFFTDDKNYDVGLLGEDFMEVDEFKQEGRIFNKYYLCNERGDDRYVDYMHLFKYQSMEKLLGFIKELREYAGLKPSEAEIEKNTVITGIYSPMSHELQLPFALAVSRHFSNQGRVLFLDLEEVSILSELISISSDKTMMDLLYQINSDSAFKDFKAYVNQFMGIDYICPFTNPEELSQVECADWIKLFEVIRREKYDQVVVLMGKAINGLSRVFEGMDQIFLLSKPGDYYKKGEDVFMEYVGNINLLTPIKQVLLPMSAGNLTNGAYCMEELMAGNLGVFVKKLVEAGAQGQQANV